MNFWLIWPFLDILGQFGPFFGYFWSFLAICGQFWSFLAILIHFDLFWPIFGSYCVHFGPILDHFIHFSPIYWPIFSLFRYSDILLRRVSAGSICFSETLKSFVSLTPDGAVPFNAEEFTDPNELRALVELIGPYGIQLLNETLMWHIGSQVGELKKLVFGNKDVLEALRTNFDKPGN